MIYSIKIIKMKFVLFLIVVSLIQKETFCAMSEAQIKSATGLLRKVCQPKTKVTSAQIEEFHTGVFTKTPEIMSYMECILRSAQIMKDGKIVTGDSIMNQMKNLPAGLSEKVIATYEFCKTVEGSDKYELAFVYYKCFYEHDVESFFLP